MNQGKLEQAIRGKHEVKFRYKDGRHERTFQPYILYRKSNRSIGLGGYSEYNPDKPLERHEWRNLDVDEIGPVTITEETFTPDAAFNPRDKPYASGIICHVKQYPA
jgi:predicted DNA-binding transcriptional regulator YafY